ncbi:MAG TPA: sulfur carrier protein ThiS [Solirubrobacterales bacterium]|nr:sulfur carrier protein ThiS [Solirubrobacterales bacterium]
MRIEVNGELVEVDSGASVGAAVAHTGADPDRRGVAVAVGGEVVPRSAWETTRLHEGDKVEVVAAVQGG